MARVCYLSQIIVRYFLCSKWLWIPPGWKWVRKLQWPDYSLTWTHHLSPYILWKLPSEFTRARLNESVHFLSANYIDYSVLINQLYVLSCRITNKHWLITLIDWFYNITPTVLQVGADQCISMLFSEVISLSIITVLLQNHYWNHWSTDNCVFMALHSHFQRYVILQVVHTGHIAL